MTLLTIGELARRAGVATSAVRYYEARGLIHAVRTHGNQRRFDQTRCDGSPSSRPPSALA